MTKGKKQRINWRKLINLLIVIGLFFNVLLLSAYFISENIQDYLNLKNSQPESMQVDTETAVQSAIEFLRNKSIFYQDRQDAIEDVVAQIEERLETNPSIEEVIPSLSHLAFLAGGKHGYIKTTANCTIDSFDMDKSLASNNTWETPRVRLEDEIMYLTIPSNSGEIISTDVQVFVQQYLAEPLKEIEAHLEDMEGLVVDLTDNRGGRPELMISLVAPFLERGHLFTKVYPDGRRVDYDLYGPDFDRYFHQISLDPTEYQIANQVNLPIAVIVNHNTTSAAEWTLLAILSQQERQSVRVFGQETGNAANEVSAYQFHPNYIVVTATAELELSDGTRYGKEPIQPDEYHLSMSSARKSAIDWLRKN